MIRPLLSLASLLAAYVVLAAPAPEPFKSGWGKPVDPSRDCKFVIKSDTLTIELPCGDHDLAPTRGRFNAPRLLRDVEGDFEIRIRVSGSFRPSSKSSVDGEDPKIAAGLVLIPADANCIRLEYGGRLRQGDLRIGPNFRILGERLWHVEQGWAVPWKQKRTEKEQELIYLSLERRGNVIYENLSPDGKRWYCGFNVELSALPAKLKVGLAAYSTSTEPFKATFDRFKIIRGERKGPEPVRSLEGKFAK